MEMKMAMRRGTRQELRKLRELARYFLADVTCYFCDEPLIDTDDAHHHGDGEGSPFDVGITIHHRDGDHSNGSRRNLAPAHRRCHKSYHLKERHKANRKARRAARRSS
jgi:hypothetical protein